MKKMWYLHSNSLYLSIFFNKKQLKQKIFTFYLVFLFSFTIVYVSNVAIIFKKSNIAAPQYEDLEDDKSEKNEENIKETYTEDETLTFIDFTNYFNCSKNDSALKGYFLHDYLLFKSITLELKTPPPDFIV